MPGVSSGTKLPSPTNITCMMLALVPSPPTPSYDSTAGKDGARQRGQSIGHRWPPLTPLSMHRYRVMGH
jgi:hypothetical protein